MRAPLEREAGDGADLHTMVRCGEPVETPATLSGTDLEVVRLLVQHLHRTVVHTSCGVAA